jgi:NAD(P)-dependent dehydrogenase (short-subunit alcohol dehydrogenase family)
MSLAGKKIIITGAAGGLGTGVARVAFGQGAEVVLLDVIDDFTSELGQTYSVDLLNAEAVQRVFELIGDFDVLANIAGGFDMGPSVDGTEDEFWQRMFDINVTTLRRVLKAAVPVLVGRGRGSIINVGAAGALQGAAYMSAYLASKATVMRLTESLCEEVKAAGVNVNAVLPSVIDTPSNRHAMPDADFDAWVSPSDLGEVICFLGSDLARAVHGALVPVRGLV